VPPPIRTAADSGLPAELLSDLVIKAVYFAGTISQISLIENLRVPFGVIGRAVQEHIDQAFFTTRSGAADGQATAFYSITQKGEERARLVLDRSDYAGPAPVPLEAYTRAVRAQAESSPIASEQVEEAYRDLVFHPDFLEQLGPAINARASLFLYGHPGNGKTAVAHRIARLLGDDIYIPYAVSVDTHIIRLYDESQHRPAGGAGVAADGRWIRVHRPAISTGGELTMADLDLTYEPTVKFYEGPPQLKANGGVFIIDDFGRQIVSPVELLNRWIVPLAERVDYLSLHTGKRIQVPFEQMIVFSTNLTPQQLLIDEAFMRRIRYKLAVPDPDEASYREIFRRACLSRGVPFDEGAVTYLVRQRHARSGVPLRACHPGDLVQLLTDLARYRHERATLSQELLDRAWDSYFSREWQVTGSPLPLGAGSPLPLGEG
jgi:hypothetical protein